MKKTIFRRFIIFAGILSLACTMRVSEWVLINTPPENYSLVYFHRGNLTENAQKQNEALRESLKNCNVRFNTLKKEDIEQPYYALYYKDRLFKKFANANELKDLASSPMREKIARELMDGRLCVMVYLKSDDKAKDEKGLQVLQKTVNASPFKDIITIVELSRSSAEESHFASMLLNVEDDLKYIKEPMLFGIFGRFKALEPLLAGGITGENINYMIEYLTAECSCLIKDELPGVDMLYAGNWENPKPALLNNLIDANPNIVK